MRLCQIGSGERAIALSPQVQLSPDQWFLKHEYPSQRFVTSLLCVLMEDHLQGWIWLLCVTDKQLVRARNGALESEVYIHHTGTGSCVIQLLYRPSLAQKAFLSNISLRIHSILPHFTLYRIPNNATTAYIWPAALHDTLLQSPGSSSLWIFRSSNYDPGLDLDPVCLGQAVRWLSESARCWKIEKMKDQLTSP